MHAVCPWRGFTCGLRGGSGVLRGEVLCILVLVGGGRGCVPCLEVLWCSRSFEESRGRLFSARCSAYPPPTHVCFVWLGISDGPSMLCAVSVLLQWVFAVWSGLVGVSGGLRWPGPTIDDRLAVGVRRSAAVRQVARRSRVRMMRAVR
ncbi:hypothetical protein T484DRAFT_1975556 [Baffinella frigidus]|nr:hypothetical protein T484DRAFT_1975556 [Cryptophyta sp. CCMP2293]